nr:PREDICTED: uncharacterized protein LOC107397438 [Tribolium castaneum]|eukprot:XP_015832925.1 PREDICTED: uncharacterized protein LOC107397438 [Tribolium castaneum]
MSHPNNLNEIIARIFTLWKYTSLPVYKFEIKAGFISTNVQTFYFGIALCSVLFCFNSLNISDDNRFEFALLDDSVNFIESLTFFVQNSCMLIICYKKRKQIVKILPELQISANVILKLTLNQWKRKYYKNIKSKFLAIIVIKYGLLILNFVMDCLNFPEHPEDSFVYHVSWCFHFHFWFLVLFYLLVLTEQFSHFNRHLVKIKKKKYVQCNIKKIIKIHKLLLERLELIEKAFEVLWLIKCVSDIIRTSLGVFYLIEMFVVMDEVDNLLLYCLYTLVWTILIVLENFLEIVIVDKILQQNSTVCDHIIELLPNIRTKSKTLFCVNTFINEVQITICGLFPLNCFYISWMVTAIATYVVYSLQFNKIKPTD